MSQNTIHFDEAPFYTIYGKYVYWGWEKTCLELRVLSGIASREQIFGGFFGMHPDVIPILELQLIQTQIHKLLCRYPLNTP